MENSCRGLHGLFCQRGHNFALRHSLAYPLRVSKKRASIRDVPRGTRHEKKLSGGLDSKILARARQYGSEVSTLNAPRAILSATPTNVKSFLRVWTKLF